jgi:hypothetical protein
VTAALLAGSAAVVSFAAPPTHSETAAPTSPAPTLAARARNDCPLPSDAYLRAKLAGSVNRTIDWRAGQMECEGMRRPDGRGVRVTFRGRIGDEPVTFVFGVPRLDEGAAARAVPVNLTIIREGHGFYGTRGDDKCTLDDVRQIALAPAAVPGAATAATAPSGATGTTAAGTSGTSVGTPAAKPAAHRWRIEARGFCLEPARAVGGRANDAILASTFDFAGYLTWDFD